MSGPLARAIEREDVPFVQGYLCARLETELSQEKTQDLICKAHKFTGKRGFGDWLDSTWICWLRNRLASEFPVGCQANDVRLLCELHIGFLFLEETPEMLLRLPEGQKVEPSAARSKISKSLLERLEPIDRVAARVSPEFA